MRNIIQSVAAKAPLAEIFTPKTPIHLLYHGVPRHCEFGINQESFRGHMLHLKKHYNLLHPSQGFSKRKPSAKTSIVLTFDDGFKNNFEVAMPILQELEIPALFFISHRHSQPGKYLWFCYLTLLENFYPKESVQLFGKNWDLTKAHKGKSLAAIAEKLKQASSNVDSLYSIVENEFPQPEEFMTQEQIDDNFAGMTAEQILKMSKDDLFEIGIHTKDHPYLSLCTDEVIREQIQSNKEYLEKLTGKEHNTIAYPIGDYDQRVLEICSQLNIKSGQAVRPSIGCNEKMELPRMGIYSNDLIKLDLKVKYGQWMRKLDLNLG